MEINITQKSKELFIAYIKDANNWSGNPWTTGNVDLTKYGRGNLTQLKKAGLLATQKDEGGSFIVFLPLAYEYAKELGIHELLEPSWCGIKTQQEAA